MDLKELKEKSEIVTSETYRKLRQHQINKIISLANSQIEPLELKGMLKQIANTDSWIEDYEKELKKSR